MASKMKTWNIYSWMVFILSALAAAAVLSSPSPAGYAVFVAASAASALAWEAVISYARRKELFFSKSAYITGLFVGLILQPSPVWAGATVAAIAIILKHAQKVAFKKHFFNPAALGLAAAFALTPYKTAWWGLAANISAPAGWLVIIGSLFIAWKLGRLFTLTIPFLAFNAIFVFLIFGQQAGLPDALSSLPFAGLMLVEPVTSRLNSRKSYFAFAAIVALVALALRLAPFPSDPLLFGLLIGNLFVPALNRLIK